MTRLIVRLVLVPVILTACLSAEPADPAGPGASADPASPPGAGPLPLPPAGFCSGTGPLIDVPQPLPPPGSGDQCQPSGFAAAVCSCTDIDVKGYLRVGLTGGTATGGDVGANGTIAVDGFADVGGAVVAAGPGSLGFFGYLRTGGELSAAGSVSVHDQDFIAGYLETGGDARVNGDLLLLGYADIGGDLTQPPGSARPVVTRVDGALVSGPVTVAAPCPCAAGELIDIATPIADARADNDNAATAPPPGPGRAARRDRLAPPDTAVRHLLPG